MPFHCFADEMVFYVCVTTVGDDRAMVAAADSCYDVATHQWERFLSRFEDFPEGYQEHAMSYLLEEVDITFAFFRSERNGFDFVQDGHFDSHANDCNQAGKHWFRKY